MNNKPRQNGSLALLAVLALSCGSMRSMPLPQPKAIPWDAQYARAGAAVTDITPPLGLSLFGHGPEGRVAVGTSLRLRCQAFVILGADPNAEAVALVPCDLSAPSLLLQREIAERVATAGIPLGAQSILLMATHTHSAPGNFYAAHNYVGPFSTRRTGFDSRVLAFLAERIAGAIVEAFREATGPSGRVQLRWSQRAVEHALTRNRDPLAFVHNRQLPKWLSDRIHDHEDRAEEAAVDPTLSVLRIDRVRADGALEPYALFAAYGVHPSALPNSNTSYSGDVFGYASRYVAATVSAVSKQSKFIVGIANGIEGDVMPNRTAASLRESRRLAHRLAAEIIQGWSALSTQDTQRVAEPHVHVAYRELTLSGATTTSGALCERPELGTASAGGANDHPTMLRVFPQANPGARALQATACADRKLPVLPIQGESAAGVDYPGVAPVAVVQIGDHYIVALPGELTTVSGVRIREAVADELQLTGPTDGNVGRSVVMVGLTNEYLQYIASADEYPLQFYEGASTLYGPKSAEFFMAHARCLARWLRGRDDQDCRLQQALDVNVLGDVRYAPSPESSLIEDERCDKATQLRLTGVYRPVTTRDALLRVDVRFKGPRPECLRKRDHLWVQVRSSGEPSGVIIADDAGTTVTTAYDYEREEWIASWIPDLPVARETVCDHEYHMIVGSGVARIDSREFKLTCDLVGDASKVWP